MIKLISWNLLRLTGASLDDVVRLIQREQPDVLLMQEATEQMDGLVARVGGQYLRSPMPGRKPAGMAPAKTSTPRLIQIPSRDC